MFGYACDRCREKHQSCNHELPCKRCIKANVADACHYTPKRTRSKNMATPTLGPSLRHVAGGTMSSSGSMPRNTVPPPLMGTGPPSMFPLDSSSMIFYAGLPGQGGGSRADGLPHHPPSHFAHLPPHHHHHHLPFAPHPPPLMFPFDPKMGGIPPPPPFFSPQGGSSFMPSVPHPMLMMPPFPPPQYPSPLPMMPQFEPRRSMTPNGSVFPLRQPPPPPFYLPSEMMTTPPFQRKSNSALSEAMLFGNSTNTEPPSLPPPEELMAPPFPLPGFNHSYTFPETQGGVPSGVSSGGSSGSIHDSVDGQGMMNSGVHVQEYIRDALAMIHDDGEKDGNNSENRDHNISQKVIGKTTTTTTTSETSSMSRLLNAE